MRAACLASRAARAECDRRELWRKAREAEPFEHRLRNGGDFAPAFRCRKRAAPACEWPAVAKLKGVDVERDGVEFPVAEIIAQRGEHSRFQSVVSADALCVLFQGRWVSRN